MLETELALWKPPANPDTSDDQLSSLRSVPLFRDLSDSELKKVMKLLHERHYKPDEIVFREGQTGAGMYIIKSGEVEIIARLEDGSEKPLVALHDRQFFGELALLEHAPRSATCVVRKPTVLLGIFQSDLELLVDRNSRLGAKVIWNLARLTGMRLRELSSTVRGPLTTPPNPPQPRVAASEPA